MKMPFKCPVCGGNGILSHGFYDVPIGQEFMSTDCSPITCRTCNGVGIIWSDEEENNEETQFIP